MAASQTEVVNLALSGLGESQIISLDDPTKTAALAKLHWRPTVEAVIRAYPWNCTKKVRVLAPEATAPADENWSYQFILPPDCLRVFKTSEDSWEIQQRRILANTDTLTIYYGQYIEDVTIWDPLMVQAVSLRLSHILAMPLIQSSSAKDSFYESYRKALSEARTIDAQEGTDSHVEALEWLEARL